VLQRVVTKLKETPTAKRKEGKIRSARVKPFQSEWVNIGSAKGPSAFTMIIRQIVRPLNTSRAMERCGRTAGATAEQEGPIGFDCGRSGLRREAECGSNIDTSDEFRYYSRMTTLKTRPTREETQERILVKADEFFQKFGYDKTTVADIAVALEMSPANIYKFFASKDAVIEAIGERNLQEFRSEISTVMHSKRSALERIETVFFKLYQFNKKKLSHDMQLYKVILRSFEENWKCCRDFNEVLTKVTTDLIEAGVESGEFHATDSLATAKILLDSFVWVIHPILFYKLDHENVESRLHRHMLFVGQALK
jgi:AcrR family transcriptional regulator